MEEYFFFKNKSQKNIFGVIHYPEGESSKGVLICHPIFEEKLHVHRMLVEFSRFLASSGFKVMRFDYYGEGDSDGEFEDANLDTRLSDINSALSTFKTKTPLQSTALLGIRFGATLAALWAEKEKGIDALILFVPIINGNDYLHQLLRINLTHQVVVYKKILHTREDLVKGLSEDKKINVEGYEISNKFYQQVSGINLLSQSKTFRGKTLLLQVSPDKTGIDSNLDKLKSLYTGNNLSEILVSADLSFWSDMKYYPPCTAELNKKTRDWLKANL